MGNSFWALSAKPVATVAGYEGLDVAGKIVLVDRFRCPTGGTLAGRVRLATAAGALAVLVYNNVQTNTIAGTLSSPDPVGFVPCGFINQVDGLALKERLEAGEVLETHFRQTQLIETRITQNIFVETEGGDPENAIMMGARLDSVQAGPGINDDGSGSSLLIEVFTALSKHKTKNKVRFVWWGAEENGLLGSDYYCANIGVTEANKILAYLNFDMVSKGYYGVGDLDGSAYGLKGPAGSEIIQALYHQHFEGKGLTVTPAMVTNGSDYASFRNKILATTCDTNQNPEPDTYIVMARAAAHMVSLLSMEGTKLIPKTPINATIDIAVARQFSADPLAIAKMEAMGERHLGCGHEE